MGKIKVRWANIKDAYKIAYLELRSARFENRLYPLDIPLNLFERTWQDRISSGEYITIVGTVDGELAGFLSLYRSIKSGDICCLYIDPLYFRKGVGQRLMRTAELMVRRKGGKKLKVEVEGLNFGAQQFYERLQFKSVSVKLSHLIIMIKELQHA